MSKKSFYVFIVFAVLFGALAYLISQKKLSKVKTWDERENEIQMIQLHQEELLANIRDSVGQQRCRNSFNCRVVGVGPKVCKKFREFVIYSDVDASVQNLLSSIRKFNSNAQKLNNINFAVKKCGFDPPQVHCVSDICKQKEN